MAAHLFPRTATVIGIDCSLSMARRARARTEESGQPRLVLAASVSALPFRDASIQLALCVNTLEFVDDRAAAFHEIARVLAPSGVAIIGVLNRRSPWELSRRLRRPFTRDSYYRGRFFREGELHSHVEAAGLEAGEILTAVHFPPLSSILISRLYPRIDLVGRRLFPARGAVLLCRATKPSS